MPSPSQPIKALKVAERWLTEAKAGDPTSTRMLRDLVRKAADSAPDKELIEIADLCTDFLRRHIRNHVQKN